MADSTEAGSSRIARAGKGEDIRHPRCSRSHTLSATQHCRTLGYAEPDEQQQCGADPTNLRQGGAFRHETDASKKTELPTAPMDVQEHSKERHVVRHCEPPCLL